MEKCLRVVILGLAMLIGASGGRPTPAVAGPTYSGTITGAFDTPTLIGAYFDADSRQPVECDNTSGDGGFGAATSNFTWGDAIGGSAVEFVGNSFSDVAAGEVFPLGTVAYFNGWNTPASLVFGLSMQLSAGEGITPFVGAVEMTSTLNHNVDRLADADVLTFDAVESPITLAAFEKATVKATVYGKITGDSELQVTSMRLAPGESEHGCVSDAPLGDSLPCASVCGSVCAAGTSALAGPICGGEKVPAALQARLDHAVRLFERAAGKNSERRAKKGVRRAMKMLERSGAMAAGAVKGGRVSAACAEAIDRAIKNVQGQAEPWLAAS
jgi:hypothetical protein